MTVLMTADTIGGVWAYAVDLARAYTDRGVRVVLATMGDPLSRAQQREAAEIATLQVESSRYQLEWMPDPWRDVAAAGEWLLALEQRCRPDVVHLNGYAHGALPFGAPVVVAAHSCVLSWWHAVKGGEAPATWHHYRDAARSGLAGARLVVAPSQDMADAVERWYAPPAPIRVVHNGRNPAAYGAGPKEDLVLSAGRFWDEAKNVAAVVKAARYLTCAVCLAGDAAPGSDLSTVTHLGRLSARRLAVWYSRAAVYALPARYEPFGLTALEAALSGCALVLGDIPSLREIWGRAATFVDPDDARGLARAITALIDDSRQRRAMAARARARARRYTMARAADAYLSIYHDLAHGTAPSGDVHACAS